MAAPGEGRRLILRVVNGRIPRGTLQAVLRALERAYVPAARRHVGLDRYLVATLPTDDGHAVAFMTLWLDLEAALTAYDGDLAAVRTLDGVDHGELLDDVVHYELEVGETDRTSGRPRYLRLTAGTVRPGLDAEIQRELRARLVELGPEVIDAYIGRRVEGSSVEICFISTWSDRADEAAIRQPIWPQISAQYETFSIRVFDVLLEGSLPH